MRQRPGTTLAELLVTTAVAAIVASIAVAGAARIADALAARAAAREVRAALAVARDLAVLRARRAAVRVDTVRGVVTVLSATDTPLTRPLRTMYGVRLSTTRDSIAYGANGLGFGAANTRVVIARRAAAETITVSRLGRVR